jgi:hypothetical protein
VILFGIPDLVICFVGLDATSSIELLGHLNQLAYTNRTVVLTIHQPRFEIFYMFHKLILLSDGQVAYHGVPQKAYGFFVEALMSKYLNRGLSLPQLEEHNPADVIMDMLGKPWMREVILNHYQESAEPELIRRAIKCAKVRDFESISIATLEKDDSQEMYASPATSNDYHRPLIVRASRQIPQANWFMRLAVLEARASKRTSKVWMFYLPIIFFAYGLLLGTVYFQQSNALLVMSGFCVYSVASALFMFPVLQNYYLKTLEVYGFEKADGAGRACDIVLQGFTRFVTMAIIPVIACALVLYLLLVNMQFWSVTVFLQLVLVSMTLNQTWISLLIFLLCSVPNYAFRLSPIISSIAGFTSGFFLPLESAPWLYRWIYYINPNYYGFSAAARFLLTDFKTNCTTDDVECYLTSGSFVLQQYDFDSVSPYRNLAILLLMTVIYLILAILSNWLRYTNAKKKLRALFKSKDDVITKENRLALEEEEEEGGEGEEGEFQIEGKGSESSNRNAAFTESILHGLTESIQQDDVFEMSFQSNDEILSRNNHSDFDDEQKKVRNRAMSSLRKTQRIRAPSILLKEDQHHCVYKPRQNSISSKKHVIQSASNSDVKDLDSSLSIANPNKTSLKERQHEFDLHVKATQEVVKETTEVICNNAETAGAEAVQKTVMRGLTVKLSKHPRINKKESHISLADAPINKVPDLEAVSTATEKLPTDKSSFKKGTSKLIHSRKATSNQELSVAFKNSHPTQDSATGTLQQDEENCTVTMDL